MPPASGPSLKFLGTAGARFAVSTQLRHSGGLLWRLGGLGGALFGALFGIPALRIKRFYLALTTIAAQIVFPLFASMANNPPGLPPM